jgi:hypothetical protein
MIRPLLLTLTLAASAGAAWGQQMHGPWQVYDADLPASREAELCRMLPGLIYFQNAHGPVCGISGPHACCASTPADPKCKSGQPCS